MPASHFRRVGVVQTVDVSIFRKKLSNWESSVFLLLSFSWPLICSRPLS